MSQVESERPLEQGTVVARNYRVLTRLGAGGMGTVYLAENLTLQQRVVVKVLLGGKAGAGHEEAQMLANLQHPNVVTVYAHDPQLDCIVMEFLDGASLSSLLEKGVDRVSAIRIALSVAEALAAVHKRGLVHRDIKPENVMLTLNQGGGGRFVDWLKLIDFGTALKAGKVPEVLLGTPEYCPPEQFHPEPAHPANDVYALGTTIFLMMTGVFPFEGERDDLPRQHHEVTPPGLLDKLIERFGRAGFDPRTIALLEDLSELVAQMLAKRLQDRPTAQEVARRLTRLESSFAEAGTVVAGTASSLPFIEPLSVPRHTATRSVLSKVLVPGTGEEPALRRSSSSTSPDVEPVMSTADAHLEMILRQQQDEVRESSAPDLQSVPTQLATPALRRNSAAHRAAAAALAQEPTAPAGRALASPTPVPVHDVDDDELAPRRSNKGLIIALVAVVALLAGALVFLDALGGGDKPKPVDVVATPKQPVEKPKVEPAPPEDPPTPVVEVDAGVAAPEPVDAGVVAPTSTPTPTPVGKKPKLEKGGCIYDDVFERNARKAMNGLQKGATPAQAERLEDLGDELYAAFKARDCRKTQAVLKKMSVVVRGK